jgi:hypothetical protein
MKSSLHSLIPFLPFILNYSVNCKLRRLDSVLFLCSQDHILRGWRLETQLTVTLAALDPRYIALGVDSQKTPLPLLLRVDSLLKNMLTAQLRSNESGADPQRMPLAAPLQLLCDITAYVTRSSATVT